jgi:hypothetical protein
MAGVGSVSVRGDARPEKLTKKTIIAYLVKRWKTIAHEPPEIEKMVREVICNELKISGIQSRRARRIADAKSLTIAKDRALKAIKVQNECGDKSVGQRAVEIYRQEMANGRSPTAARSRAAATIGCHRSAVDKAVAAFLNEPDGPSTD